MSTTVTFVAFERPLFVTIIVKLTRSPTCAVSFAIVLMTVRLTCGLTVTFVMFEGTSVLFSLQLTEAMFLSVPFANTFT